MTLGELAIAFSDVVIDGVVVECSRGADQATAGSLQSICWGSQASLLSSSDKHTCSSCACCWMTVVDIRCPAELVRLVHRRVSSWVRTYWLIKADAKHGKVSNAASQEGSPRPSLRRSVLAPGNRGAQQRLHERLAHSQGGGAPGAGPHGAVPAAHVLHRRPHPGAAPAGPHFR